MKTAVLAVNHPGIGKAFLPFAESLLNQTDLDFTLLLGNDNCDKEKLEGLPSNISVDHFDLSGMSISENRFYLINKAISLGFELLIFADCDDYFSSNRVSKTKELLENKEKTILVNEITLVDDNGILLIQDYFSPQLNDYSNLPDLKCFNFAGLSNTALSTNGLSLPPLPPNNLKPLDWYFFSYLMETGWKLSWTQDIITYYRQHSNNSVGIGNWSKESEQDTKNQRHLLYTALQNLGFGNYSSLIEANNNTMNKDCKDVDKNPFWWELPKIEI